ncbi:DUF4124 domain-containing protein [Caenimonas sp. SL110]|uniref:DUF4124 domain-containing protein n=1 Tax=Caenimonas sp. SL110 TaxID=1450524 RepID=UPI00350F8E28
MLAFAAPSHAQVSRCTTAAGKVEYTDGPCVNGTSRPVQVNQNSIPSSGHREQVLRDENERLRRQLEVNKISSQPQLPTAANTSALGRTESDLAAEKGGTMECARAKRNYEVATSSIQPNRNTDADELAMYSACGIKPPDKTVINVTNVHLGRAPPNPITNCDSGGCWDSAGTRYNRSGGTLFGPRGACVQTGTMLRCP